MSEETVFATVICDVYCIPKDEKLPVYRVYVGDKLFAERTWFWDMQYLEELLQIQAPPGKYNITYELTDPTAGRLWVDNVRLLHAPEGSRAFNKHEQISIRIADASE